MARSDTAVSHRSSLSLSWNENLRSEREVVRERGGSDGGRRGGGGVRGSRSWGASTGASMEFDLERSGFSPERGGGVGRSGEEVAGARPEEEGTCWHLLISMADLLMPERWLIGMLQDTRRDLDAVLDRCWRIYATFGWSMLCLEDRCLEDRCWRI